jgi:hypothetical protein
VRCSFENRTTYLCHMMGCSYRFSTQGWYWHPPKQPQMQIMLQLRVSLAMRYTVCRVTGVADTSLRKAGHLFMIVLLCHNKQARDLRKAL